MAVQRLQSLDVPNFSTVFLVTMIPQCLALSQLQNDKYDDCKSQSVEQKAITKDKGS
jgi:hypothetical protein